MSSCLLVAVDLGSSQTRVFWRSGGEHEVTCKVFSSDCGKPTGAQAQGQLRAGSFYVRYGKSEFVVGADVAPGFLSDDLRDGFKFEGAVPKVLAALHIVSWYSKLSEREWQLSVLLPHGELKSFPLLKTSLESALKGFTCNGKEYSLEPERLSCWVEGASLIDHLATQYVYYKDIKLLTVMAGYRDMTMFRSVGSSEVTKAKTAPLGFLWMLKDIEEQVGDIDRLRATELLYPLGLGRITMTTCKPLSRATLPKMASQDAKRIAKVATVSRQKYLDVVEDIFSRLALDDIDHILLLGGTGKYLLPTVKKVVGDKVGLPELLYKQVERAFSVDPDEAARLADGFCRVATGRS